MIGPRTPPRPDRAKRTALAIVAIFTAATLAAAAPEAVASATLERNVSFLLARMGLAEMPDGLATVHDLGGTREMPISDALRHAAARAGGLDLSAVSASASSDADVLAAGDVWVIEIGIGMCRMPTTLPLTTPRIGAIPQLNVYGGTAGYVVTPGAGGIVIDWVQKTTTTYSGSVLVTGFSDWFCLQVWGLYIFFPFVNGVVTGAEHRPAIGSIVIEDDGTGRTYTTTYPQMGFTCTDGTSGLAYTVRCVAPPPGPPFAGWKCTALAVSAKAPLPTSSVRGDVDCGAGTSATTGSVHGPSGWVSASAPDAAGITEVRCSVLPAGSLLTPVPPYIVKCSEP